MDKDESYIYGLLLADGSMGLLERNRGRVQLEVNIKDKDIAVKLFNHIPNSRISERTRNTNFKNEYHTCIFSNHHKWFRDWLIACGFPVTNKTFDANVPSVEFDEKSFWRGFLDGDGSLGFTKEQVPFVSIVTDSEAIKQAYLNFLYRNYAILKNASRNARDNAYNLVVLNEAAVQLAKDLYLDNDSDLYLKRKKEKAIELQKWVRIKSMNTKYPWTHELDRIILSASSLKEASKLTHKTIESITKRLSLLKSYNICE